MKNNKKPRLRFKGFNDDWEQRKAKELCSITTGKSNTQDQVDDGIYPFYIRSDQPVKSNKYLFNEEAVITIGDGNIGKVFHYVNGKFDLHQRCYKMADFKCISGKYFYWYFSTKFYKRAISMTAKATVDSVRLEMIADMNIKYPSDVKEQNKIQTLLFNLDNLIALHQRKYEKLTNAKKALLDKMFPKNSEKFPKIRFKGFFDAWEQRKLGDEADYIIAGGDVNQSLLVDLGRYPVIANALTNEGIAGYYENEYRVKAPAVTITGRGDIGHAKARKVDFTPIVRLLTIKTKHNVHFLENSINQKGFIIESTGVPQLTVPKVRELKLSFSKNYNEEIYIGNFFYALDNLIALHQRKGEKLKNLKIALLEQMFV